MICCFKKYNTHFNQFKKKNSLNNYLRIDIFDIKFIVQFSELSVALKRLHDSFVALAGRLQTAHSQVMAQKERHLSLRRHFIKDSSNIFQPAEKREIIPRKTTFQTTASPGPTPFSCKYISCCGWHYLGKIF